MLDFCLFQGLQADHRMQRDIVFATLVGAESSIEGTVQAVRSLGAGGVATITRDFRFF
jgi:hypothetical protein